MTRANKFLDYVDPDVLGKIHSEAFDRHCYATKFFDSFGVFPKVYFMETRGYCRNQRLCIEKLALYTPQSKVKIERFCRNSVSMDNSCFEERIGYML